MLGIATTHGIQGRKMADLLLAAHKFTIELGDEFVGEHGWRSLEVECCRSCQVEDALACSCTTRRHVQAHGPSSIVQQTACLVVVTYVFLYLHAASNIQRRKRRSTNDPSCNSDNPMRHAKYPMPDVLYPYLNMQGILDARILRLVLLLELPGKELPVELAWAPE
jgi:hypothetical protein